VGGEHGVVDGGADPVRAGLLRGAEEHGRALRNLQLDRAHVLRGERRAVDLDELERVVVDGEGDARERARVDQAQAVPGAAVSTGAGGPGAGAPTSCSARR
jgi:hypothetical protein